jgi:hypothetical protein
VQRLSKDDYRDWLQHPITEHYLKYITAQVETRKYIAGNGGLLADDSYVDIGQRYARLMDTVGIYESMLETLKIDVGFKEIIPKEEREDDGSEDSEDAWSESTD